MTKKADLRAQIAELRAGEAAAMRLRADAERRDTAARAEIRRLKAELEVIKTNWRPVPMAHEWQPRDPQCALCDEPRDAARHRADTP